MGTTLWKAGDSGGDSVGTSVEGAGRAQRPSVGPQRRTQTVPSDD
jgi:hypothetical protein